MLNKDKSNQNEKTRNRTRYLLKEKSMKNILKVRMLGGFTLEYKGKELVLDRNNVSKTTQLFQLLLLHTQDGGISKAALIDALYGRSDVENKNGSLNNTIFRLRKQLTAAGLPESSYININGGMCTWDPDIETSVDVCDFKQTIESARHEKSQKTKMEIDSLIGMSRYKDGLDVYKRTTRLMFEELGLNFINIETDDENQKYYSELLRESIQKAVRKGDFYTRYNIQQYLVMLIGITQENCTLVSKRINKEFNKRLTRRKNVSIDYYVASLGEVCND